MFLLLLENFANSDRTPPCFFMYLQLFPSFRYYYVKKALRQEWASHWISKQGVRGHTKVLKPLYYILLIGRSGTTTPYIHTVKNKKVGREARRHFPLSLKKTWHQEEAHKWHRHVCMCELTLTCLRVGAHSTSAEFLSFLIHSWVPTTAVGCGLECRLHRRAKRRDVVNTDREEHTYMPAAWGSVRVMTRGHTCNEKHVINPKYRHVCTNIKDRQALPYYYCLTKVSAQQAQLNYDITFLAIINCGGHSPWWMRGLQLAKTSKKKSGVYTR